MGNTSPPENDPGWRNVGQHLGSPSVVYLGNGWVLTAAHVGPSIVKLEGQSFDPIAGSPTRVMNPDGSPADLLLYKIDGDPQIPALRIATSSPQVGQEVILIAAGSSRSERITVFTEDRGIVDGFRWKSGQTKRWGTNIIEGEPRSVQVDETVTTAVPIVFDRIESASGTRHEASAAKGDSGGAVFAQVDPLDPESPWVLSGLIFSVASAPEHPKESSFYGDATWVADLSQYRQGILESVYPDGNPAGSSPTKSSASQNEGASTLQTIVTLCLWSLVAFSAWKVFLSTRQSDR